MEVKDRITVLVSEMMSSQSEQTEVADLVSRIERSIAGSDDEADTELSLEQLAAMAEGQDDADIDRLIADSLRQDNVNESAGTETEIKAETEAEAEAEADLRAYPNNG